jgi:uncharacterized protein (TIGR02328 family)
MRLWHKDLISLLPRQQLLGQHRECCALRGKGWGKAHSTVNYVFTYRYNRLFLYHQKVMEEMRNRGYTVNKLWFDPNYRGKLLGHDNTSFTYVGGVANLEYPEHNQAYLQECLDNLKAKGITIEWK